MTYEELANKIRVHHPDAHMIEPVTLAFSTQIIGWIFLVSTSTKNMYGWVTSKGTVCQSTCHLRRHARKILKAVYSDEKATKT